jgi:hypothetical protein
VYIPTFLAVYNFLQSHTKCPIDSTTPTDSRVRLDFIARELNGISTEEVELLLVSLILDGKFQGKIDQVQGILIKDATGISRGPTTALTSGMGGSNNVCDAMDQLISSLQTLTTNLATVASDQYLAYPSTTML